MEIEPWLLIFVPIVFVLGWIAARFDVRQMLLEQKRLPESYFRGLNFLLNDDPDKAIDAFVEVARLDPETTELHFALGNMFRRRGEIERAIRVHQSLLSRSDLPPQDREHALYEIGCDYLKAGMYDRAEEAYKAVKHTTYGLDATRALIHIYEVVHDWEHAVLEVQELQTMSSDAIPYLVHYYCELAQNLLSKQPQQALWYLKQAQQACNRNGTVASKARLQMLLAQAHPEQQQQYYLTLLDQSPDYASLIATPFLRTYDNLDMGLKVLENHFQKYPSVDLFISIFQAYLQHQPEQAQHFARQGLQHQPSLLGLDKVLELEQEQLNDDLQLLYKMTHRYRHKLDRYHCTVCGFNAKTFYWQCPGCNHWETYSPKKYEEL